MGQLSILGIVVIVVIVLIVLGILGISFSRRKETKEKGSHDSKKHEHDHSRHHVEADNTGSNGPMRYRVQKGRELEPQIEVKAPAAIPEEQFPRHAAKSGRPMVQNDNIPTVDVSSIAELYSPKEDMLAEYGVTQDEFNRLVTEAKNKSEPKERAIPSNRHFNVKSYNQSKLVARESVRNQLENHGSKRGTLVDTIYKTHGKRFATQKFQQAQPEQMALHTNKKDHDAVIANTRARAANKPKLVPRT